MDKMKLTRLERWRVCGIFCDDLRPLAAMVDNITREADLDRVVYLHSEKTAPRMPADAVFYLQHMDRRHADLITAINKITHKTLLVLDDVELIQRYPISMTRNIINHVASRTRYKIIAGRSLLTNHLYDLYAPFHALDRRILWSSHYWAFKADHREVSVFDGRTVVDNKDLDYTAMKIKPFIYFDLEPDNKLQDTFYRALSNAPLVERVQDMTELEL